MNKKSIYVVCFIFVLALTACDRLPSILPNGSQTDIVEFTQIPAAETNTIEPSATVTSEVVKSVTPPADTTATANTATPTPTIPCDTAAAGRPLDVTIPDDSVIPAGTSFTKVWRLVNAGSCAWTMDYAVVWFSGDQLGSITMQKLPHEVGSGQNIDISVDMSAPDTAGVRQGFWKLRNADAELFGIGPAGNAPFWVRIVVEEETADQPTLEPEPTPTPVTLVQGALDLSAGESLDLATGEKVPPGEGDLDLIIENGVLILRPISSAIIGLAGEAGPSQAECRLVVQGGEDMLVAAQAAGSYYCYQTGRGLPGVARLVNANADGIRLDFLTWAVP